MTKFDHNAQDDWAAIWDWRDRVPPETFEQGEIPAEPDPDYITSLVVRFAATLPNALPQPTYVQRIKLNFDGEIVSLGVWQLRTPINLLQASAAPVNLWRQLAASLIKATGGQQVHGPIHNPVMFQDMISWNGTLYNMQDMRTQLQQAKLFDPWDHTSRVNGGKAKTASKMAQIRARAEKGRPAAQMTIKAKADAGAIELLAMADGGASIEEMADHLGIKPDSVSRALLRARDRIHGPQPVPIPVQRAAEDHRQLTFDELRVGLSA